LLERKTGMIAEAFSDLLVLGTYFKDAKEIGSPDALRARLHHLFHQADQTAKAQGVSSDRLTHARYAVAAYLDEMILSSRWPHREQWLSKPLQYEFFGEFVAGEGFFTRLAAIRRAVPLDTDLLEVYSLCLLFGFEGQYRLEEQARERLQGLIKDVTREVLAKRGEVPTLSPHSGRPEEFLETVRNELPAWVVLVTSMGIVMLVYLALAFLIDHDVSQVQDQLKKLL